MRHLGWIAVFLLTASHAASASAPARPTLVVAIVVDQYSSDLFGEYRPPYQDGLATLARGVVFPHGYQRRTHAFAVREAIGTEDGYSNGRTLEQAATQSGGTSNR